MKTNHLLYCFLFFSYPFLLFSQTPDFKDPDHILVQGDNLPQVLLVGSWHFAYPGMDAHKTAEELRMNIRTEKRQAELDELLDYLARFKPTKIAVESGPIVGYLIKNYERYEAGTRKLYANERS